jgi:hypothetical protein
MQEVLGQAEGQKTPKAYHALVKYCLVNLLQPHSAELRGMLLERQALVNSRIVVPLERHCSELETELAKVRLQRDVV